MTDNDIIKALECCQQNTQCANCPMWNSGQNCMNRLYKYALALINRQKAEIEELTAEVEALQLDKDSLRMAGNSLKMHYNNATAEIERLNNHILDVTKKVKAEAIKEFLQKIRTQKWNYGEEEEPIWVVDLDDVVRLAKEMIGENTDD